MAIHLVDAAHPARTNLVNMNDNAPERPMVYLDMTGVGEWFGVPGATVAQWRKRYAASYPIPVPDVMVGRTPGWTKEREPEWRQWHASRPGQGAGGGRPRKTGSQPA